MILPQSDDTPFPAGIDSTSMTTLQRLQEDMELFSYIASHDLLAPVRVMLQYCTHLQEKSTVFPDPAQQEVLQLFNSEITRMKSLLEGLQEYIRLETFSFKHVPLDTNELVLAAMDVLGDEIRKSGVTVTYERLPMVIGHRGRLTRLFLYLIENAIKFTGGQPARIHISAKKKGDVWTFCVEDNGIGILEEHQRIIFQLFQRLHTDEVYPGYGVGLALSQKIVASHSGKMWVESIVGKGSRFFFTLPAANSKIV